MDSKLFCILIEKRIFKYEKKKIRYNMSLGIFFFFINPISVTYNSRVFQNIKWKISLENIFTLITFSIVFYSFFCTITFYSFDMYSSMRFYLLALHTKKSRSWGKRWKKYSFFCWGAQTFSENVVSFVVRGFF